VRDDTTNVPEHGLLVKQTSQDERELINVVFKAASLSKGL
jgi:hypothetical protein